MNIVRTSAPGKLILIGEHTVVYGKPALITAINKRCFATIKERTDKKIIIFSKNYGEKITTEIDGIFKKFYKAQDDWGLFIKGNDVEILKKITSSPLDYAQIIIGQFLDFFKIKSVGGLDLEIDSEIPVGSGMGSSAALAVSIISALFLIAKKDINKEKINEIALLCERIKHGRPSGADNSSSVYGGLIRFQKDQNIKLVTLESYQEAFENYYIVNTGTPEESTGEMVRRVSEFYEENPIEAERIFSEQEKLTERLLEIFRNRSYDGTGEIIKRAEENLEKLGVVSDLTKDLIRKIEKNGGFSKVCGGGGRRNKSGIILIFSHNLQLLNNVLKSFEAEQLKLDQSGLRVE